MPLLLHTPLRCHAAADVISSPLRRLLTTHMPPPPLLSTAPLTLAAAFATPPPRLRRRRHMMLLLDILIAAISPFAAGSYVLRLLKDTPPAIDCYFACSITATFCHAIRRFITPFSLIFSLAILAPSS